MRTTRLRPDPYRARRWMAGTHCDRVTNDPGGHLRRCANNDMVERVLDYLPVSAEADRVRYAAVGRALADPKRLCVLESLAIGELSVSDLSLRVGCQVPNMSQHLAVLRHAGLVTSRRDGTTILYRLADQRVLDAYRLIQDLAR
jgi:DNA-binding transcriptional ArsR family regulator